MSETIDSNDASNICNLNQFLFAVALRCRLIQRLENHLTPLEVVVEPELRYAHSLVALSQLQIITHHHHIGTGIGFKFLFSPAELL